MRPAFAFLLGALWGGACLDDYAPVALVLVVGLAAVLVDRVVPYNPAENAKRP